MIWFDNLRAAPTPSYYVQKLFADNRGDKYLATTVDSPAEEVQVLNGMIGVGSWNTAAEFKDIKVADLDGKLHALSDFRGKAVLLNLWATWCVPCKAEIPDYNKLRAKMKDRGVEWLGVTFEETKAEDVQPYLKELAIEYPVVMGTDEIDAQFGGHPGYPT